jgi:serine-type D-Ala-D-Ala carboxypeptidase (penicillin-binding protein 5/6)
MIQESKKLAFLTVIVLLIVGFSVFMRISRTATNLPENQSSEETNTLSPERYSVPEPAFFENGNKTSDSADIFKAGSNSLPKKTVYNPFSAITAKAFLVGNIETGEIYFEKDSNEQLPVASMSKLVTAIIAIETLQSTSTVFISEEEAMAPPDASGIGVGEKFTIEEMLYPMLLNSSNIAAEAIASSSDRIKFLELMSSYAWEIGMPKAYFADPSGVDPHNLASANDIFALAQYLNKFHPDILAITRIKSMNIATTSDHGAHTFSNIHPFVNDVRFIGGKTGHTTAAGETMLTILNINNQKIAFVVMGSKDGTRADDTRVLIGEIGKII